jgi:hypothetical protein
MLDLSTGSVDECLELKIDYVIQPGIEWSAATHLAAQMQNRSTPNLSIRVGRTCAESTAGKQALASCMTLRTEQNSPDTTLPEGVTISASRMAMVSYNFNKVFETDRAMTECLRDPGAEYTTIERDSPEYRRASLAAHAQELRNASDRIQKLGRRFGR